MVRNACIEKVKRNKKTGKRHQTFKKIIAYLVKINFPYNNFYKPWILHFRQRQDTVAPESERNFLDTLVAGIYPVDTFKPLPLFIY